MSDLAFAAMMFARQVHAQQRRKYTNAPYTDHLAEVAGIVSTVASAPECLAIAWLHDCIEDQGVTVHQLAGVLAGSGYHVDVSMVIDGVLALSDLEKGNRAERKAASRARLAAAAAWVQTIKCADLISNTSSIVQHDPAFAVVYLQEKRALLEVMTRADRRLHAIATELANQAVP